MYYETNHSSFNLVRRFRLSGKGPGNAEPQWSRLGTYWCYGRCVRSQYIFRLSRIEVRGKDFKEAFGCTSDDSTTREIHSWSESVGGTHHERAFRSMSAPAPGSATNTWSRYATCCDAESCYSCSYAERYYPGCIYGAADECKSRLWRTAIHRTYHWESTWIACSDR